MRRQIGLFVAALVAALACATTAQPVRIDTSGSGPVHLVLVPGLGLRGEDMLPIFANQRDRYTLHAVTLAGCGGVPALPDPEGPIEGTPWINAVSDAIAAHVLALPGKAVMVGHSLGGTLALGIATSHPDVVDGVVTLDGLPVYAVPGLADEADRTERARWVQTQIAPGVRSLPDADWAEGWKEQMRAMVTSASEADRLAGVIAAVPGPVTKRYYLEVIALDARPASGQSKVPVLALVAETSPAESLDAAGQRARWDRALAAFPAKLVLVPGAGHFVHLDAPDRVRDEVAKFLSSLNEKGGRP